MKEKATLEKNASLSLTSAANNLNLIKYYEMKKIEM